MEKQSAASLDGIPLRNVKAALRAGSKSELTAGKVLDLARKASSLEVKQMADTMRISGSLISRGLKDEDNLSFHRLWELDDSFWIELVILIAQARGIAAVKRQVILDMERSA